MRDPKVDPTVWGDVPAVALDRRVLADLRDLAASTAVEAEIRAEADVWYKREAGFAGGVAAVLDWLTGATPEPRLRELLELED